MQATQKKGQLHFQVVDSSEKRGLLILKCYSELSEALPGLVAGGKTGQERLIYVTKPMDIYYWNIRYVLLKLCTIFVGCFRQDRWKPA